MKSKKREIKKRIQFTVSDNQTALIKKEKNVNKRKEIRMTPPVHVELLSRIDIRLGKIKKEVDILNNNDTFQLLIDKLVTGNPFSFLRFGDADYMMMNNKSIGKTIGASNKMVITPEFNTEIIESHSINDPDYIIGTVLYPDLNNKLYDYNPFLVRMYKEFLRYNISYSNLVSAVALTETYISDIELFSRLILLLKMSRTMFVGSYYNEVLDDMYGEIVVRINTPKQNSYSEVDRIFDEVLQNIDSVDKVIFSCGQTSRIIIKRLWKLGIKKTMIDVGSLSDYFVLNTELGTQIQLRGHIVKNDELIKNNFEKLKQIT